MKTFAAAALVLAALPAFAGEWKLLEVKTINELKAGKVLAMKPNGYQGYVDVQLSGEKYCPGGTESLRFIWNFNPSVWQVHDGSKLKAALEIVPLGTTAPCNGGLANRTVFSWGGSAGQVNPFDEAWTRKIDGGRFWPSTGVRVMAGAAVKKGEGEISVDNRPLNPASTHAWFSVDLDTVNGPLKFIYLYEVVRGGAPAAVAAGPPATGAWRFKEVRVFNNLKEGRVLKQKHDTAGGEAEVQLDGEYKGLCPGGKEVVRVTWRFAPPVNGFDSGQKLKASIDAQMIGASGGCTGGLGDRTVFSWGGSNGQVNPFNEKDTAVIDGSRLWPSGAGRVFAKKEKQSASGEVSVDDRPNRANSTWAWQSFDVDSTGGLLKFVYLYERAGP